MVFSMRMSHSTNFPHSLRLYSDSVSHRRLLDFYSLSCVDIQTHGSDLCPLLITKLAYKIGILQFELKMD